MAGLAADARVEVAAEPAGILRTLTDDDSQGQARAQGLAAILGRAAPEARALAPFAASLLRSPAASTPSAPFRSP